MSYRRTPWHEVIAGLGKPPKFLQALMITLAVGCFADAVEPLRSWVGVLRLDPALWESGHTWRLVTYGLFGFGGISAWVLVQLVLVYWLVQQMYVWLGKRTPATLLSGIAVAGLIAAAAQALSNAVDGPACDWAPFWLMQGQAVVVALGLGVFAAKNRHSTLSSSGFVFGLPIPTRYLLPIHLLLTLGGALSTGDLGGFLGILTATTWGWRAATRRPRHLEPLN